MKAVRLGLFLAFGFLVVLPFFWGGQSRNAQAQEYPALHFYLEPPSSVPLGWDIKTCVEMRWGLQGEADTGTLFLGLSPEAEVLSLQSMELEVTAERQLIKGTKDALSPFKWYGMCVSLKPHETGIFTISAHAEFWQESMRYTTETQSFGVSVEVLPTPVPTPTPTAVPSPVPTVTPTTVPTATPSPTPSPTPALVPTATATVTPNPTATPTPASSPTPTPTATPTPAPTTGGRGAQTSPTSVPTPGSFGVIVGPVASRGIQEELAEFAMELLSISNRVVLYERGGYGLVNGVRHILDPENLERVYGVSPDSLKTVPDDSDKLQRLGYNFSTSKANIVAAQLRDILENYRNNRRAGIDSAQGRTSLTPVSSPSLSADPVLVEIEQELQEIQELMEEIRTAAEVLQRDRTLGAVIGDSDPLGIPSSFTFTRNLWLGFTLPDVQYLQMMLNSDSETRVAATGPGSPGQETTYFGPLTNAAVIRFQEKYREDVLAPWRLVRGIGFVGPFTRTKLNELLARQRARAFQPRIPGGEIRPVPPLFTEEQMRQMEELALGFGPHGAAVRLGNVGRPVLKKLLRNVTQEGRLLLNSLRILAKGGRVDLRSPSAFLSRLDLTFKVGRWADVRVTKFPKSLDHFRTHRADTGFPLLGRPFKSVAEYVDEAGKVVTNSASKKILYYHQGNLNQPRIGYLLERNGKVFLTAVGKDGTIRTFHWLKEGWSYVKEGSVFQQLFKIGQF